MAYVEEYGGQVDTRRHRKTGRRNAHPAAAAGPPSPIFDDWRSSHDKAQFHSPYRFSKPDIQSAESRTSSREWSRTDSSLRATSTMPSSLHTTRSSHRGAHGSVRHNRGKPGRPPHGGYDYDDDDDDEDEDEDEPYEVVDVDKRATIRRGASRIAPSSMQSTRRSRSAHVAGQQKSYPNSRAHSSRPSHSETEDSEDGNEEDPYDTEDSFSSSEESYESDQEKEPHDAKMPTIHENDNREREMAKERLRSRSSPRCQPPADDDGYREEDEDVVVVEEENGGPAAPPQPPETPLAPPLATSDERGGLGAEVPLTHLEHPQQPHHPQVVPEAVEDDPPQLDGHYRNPHRRSRRSKSKYTDEDWENRPRRSRRKSHHTDPADIEEELGRYRRPHYPSDNEEDRDFKHHDRDRHRQPRHSAKARPASPPAAERTRLDRPRHRRSSMDDVRPILSRSSRRQSSEEQVYATPPRRTYTSGPHMASSYSVSTSKRSSSFLSNMLGFSSHQALSPKKSPKRPRVECVVCMDKFPSSEIPKLKCGHRMCFGCLERNFRLSLDDPKHMPPKCCTQDPIPVAVVNHLFDIKFKMKWNQKLTEYTMKNPTYCPAKKCNTLLTSRDIIKRKGYRCKMGICPKCKTEVCTTCKGRWHKSKTCPHDPEANKLLGIAKEEGWQWQKCYKCNSLVELKEGCNHMTCLCGAEFCMLCGQKWKKCHCPLFNYDDADDDGLDYLNIERPARNGNPFAPAQRPQPVQLGAHFVGRRPAPPIGTNPQHVRPVSSHRPGSSHRAVPPLDFEESRPRRRRQDVDEGVRRPRITDAYDDEYELVDDDDMLDFAGIGNQAGRFMSDEYRMAAMPPSAPPISTLPPSLTRAATTGTALLPERPRQKVRRHASSLERRLADRFADSRPSLVRGSGPHTAPPGPISNVAPPVARMGPASALGTGHPPPMAPVPPAPMPRSTPRRRVVDENVYTETPTSRPRARAAPERITHGYVEEPGETHRRRSEPPKSSVLAGLTGEGRGMNRVFEWRTHVVPGILDDDSAVVAA